MQATCERLPLLGKPAFQATGAIVATASAYAAPAAAQVYSARARSLNDARLLF